MAKKKKKKSIIYFSPTRLTIFLAIIAIIITTGLLFYSPLDALLNGSQSNIATIDENGLIVHYLSIGQADCSFIEFPNGKTMLIDAGESKASEHTISYLNQNVFNDKEKTIDYVLLTHTDSDHSVGMEKIFNEYQVNKVFRPQMYISLQDFNNDELSSGEYIEDDKITNTFITAVNAFYNEPHCQMVYTNTAVMNTTQKISGGENESYYELYFYTPSKLKYTNTNDYSPIFTISYKGKTLMFTGDATSVTENEFKNSLGASQVLTIDALKVAHHGSRYSTTTNFLSKVIVKNAIIECANTPSHPHQETLNRLLEKGATIYRTNENGDIVLNITTSAQLNIICNGNGTKQTIKVEYLIIASAIVSAYFCFFVKYEFNVEKQTKSSQKSNIITSNH